MNLWDDDSTWRVSRTTANTPAPPCAELRVEVTKNCFRDACSQGENVQRVCLTATHDHVIVTKDQSAASFLAPLSRRCLRTPAPGFCSSDPGLFSFEKLPRTGPLALKIRGQFPCCLQALKRFHELLKLPDVFHQDFEFCPVNRDSLTILLGLHGVFSCKWAKGLRAEDGNLTTYGKANETLSGNLLIAGFPPSKPNTPNRDRKHRRSAC